MMGVFVQVNGGSRLAMSNPIGYVIQESGCWDWVGAISSGGYGRWRTPPAPAHRGAPAHRVMYERAKGPIPKGLQLDHLCRNRLCVNPDHLEPVTNRENTLRGENFIARLARQTHCKRGHPLSAVRGPDGGRRCRTCKRITESRRPPRTNARRRTP